LFILSIDRKILR